MLANSPCTAFLPILGDRFIVGYAQPSALWMHPLHVKKVTKVISNTI